MAVPRRLLSEVITRYKLEPDLDDIYVEGSSDKKLIDKAFNHLAVERPVYEIDSVDVCDEIIEKYGFTRGNKQEVISLCLELALPETSKVRFLVDKDMDHYLGAIKDVSGLVYTTNCDLEGVFLDEACLKDLVCDAGGVNCDDWISLYESVELAVKKVYSLRLSLYQIGYNRKLPDFAKSLKKNPLEIELCLEHLAGRCSELPIPASELVVKAQGWLTILDQIPAKDAGRGHDFFEVLEWTVKRYNGSKPVAEGLPRLLVLLASRRADAILAPLLH